MSLLTVRRDPWKNPVSYTVS